MKKIIGLVMVASALMFSSVANANDFGWNGTEFDIVLGGNFQGPSNTSLFFSVETLINSSSSSGGLASFARIGPRSHFVDFHSMYFLVGVSGGMMRDEVSFLVTIGNELNLFQRHLRILIESNAFISDTLNYMGRYSVDWTSQIFFVGIHAEQRNTLMTTGPHIGVSSAPMRTEVQYSVGTQDQNEGQSVRFVYSLIF